MLPGYFVIVAIVVNGVGSLGYLAGTLGGTTQPHRVTFFLWTLAGLIAFAAQLTEGVGAAAWFAFGGGAGAGAIFIASFFNPHGSWRISRFDVSCGALSLSGLGLWWATRDGELAILFSIAADLLAATPTIIKAYRRPDTENSFAYWACGAAGLITLLVLDQWRFADYAFAAYSFLACLGLAALITSRIGPRVAVGRSASCA